MNGKQRIIGVEKGWYSNYRLEVINGNIICCNGSGVAERV